jgi:type IV secretory pathway ATPase VirB11/archaellum biosynthesis ATPase
MKVQIQPCPNLPISVERQQQIIDGINAKLAINPRQSFIFTGRPGVGKTRTMNEIRNAVATDLFKKPSN